MSTRSRWVTAARLLAVAICIGYGLAYAVWSTTDWNHRDLDAYWLAAMRLREGLPLFPSVADVNAADVYRYSPWFAAIWVPLTFLPFGPVWTGWSACLVVATGLAVEPMIRQRTPAALAAGTLIGGVLLWSASVGNVQPILVALLVHGLGRRWGPLAIAIAASLKAAPILFILAYVARREWRAAGVAIGLTTILVAPFLLVDLTHYPGNPGSSLSLMAVSSMLYGAVLTATVVGALVIGARFPNHRWVAAGVAVVAAFPRMTAYDFTFLASGVRAGLASGSSETIRQPSRKSRGTPSGGEVSWTRGAEDDG